MQTLNFEKAGIEVKPSGIEVNTLTSHIYDRHYNITIYKDGDEYVITGDRANFEWFLERSYDQNDIDLVIPNHVEHTGTSLFGLIKSRPYVKGFCELKERTKRTYRTNNITIVQ